MTVERALESRRIYEGRILRQGTSRELVHDDVVRRIYLGEKFRMPELESGEPDADKKEEGGPQDGPPLPAGGSPRRPTK